MSASSKGRDKQNSATLKPGGAGHTRSASTGSANIKTSNHDNPGGGRRVTSGTSKSRTDKVLEPSSDVKSDDGEIPSVTLDDSRTKRLLILSNKIKNVSPVINSLLPQVKLVQYRYEGGSFDSILSQIEQAVKSEEKVDSIACILHTKPGSVLLFTNGEQKEVSIHPRVGSLPICLSYESSTLPHLHHFQLIMCEWTTDLDRENPDFL